MAVANVAWILASNGKSVLVLDWDLEAPGLHRYFRPFLIDKDLTSSEGIIDFVIAYADEAIKPPPNAEQPLAKDWFFPLADITQYALLIDFEGFPAGGSIALIPAGRQGATYATRVNSFDWKNFYVRLAGRAFMEEARRRMCHEYEYILIDSRTGVSDTAGICTVQMPDILAVCFTLNNQSIEGAAAVTKSVNDQRQKKTSESGGEDLPERKIRIVPIPMRIDSFEKDKLDRRRAYAQSKFDPFIEHIPAGDRQTYWLESEVPYSPYFGYEELLSTIRENPNDPKGVLSAMIRITNYVIRPKVPEERFSFTSLISPERRKEILQEFASTPGLDSTAGQQSIAVESNLEKQIRVAEATFLSLNEAEREMARRLLTRLVRVPRFGEQAENSRIRVDLSDLGQDAYPLVERFARSEALLVSKDETTGRETVEISNDELLRSWERLRKWSEDDVWLFRWRQELQAGKAKWEDKRRNSGELLHGPALTEARDWYKSHREYLNDSESAFLEASIDKFRRRRLNLAFAAAAIALFVPLSIYYYSRLSNRTDMADKIATEARRAIDASNSGNQQADQFQLGILLATEAERLSPSAKAEAILTQNLPQLPRKVSINTQGNNVLRVAITPSGSQVVVVTGRPRGSQSLSEDRVAQLQDTVAGSKIFGFKNFDQGSGIFALSPDGKYLATAVARNKSYFVDLVDMTTGKQVASLSHKGPVHDIAFSPNTRFLATASQDGTAQVLDILSPLEMSKPPVVLRHGGPLNAVTFSADSRYIATAGEDYLVVVRSTAALGIAYKQIGPLDGTAYNIWLSPSGDFLATITLDTKTVDVWRVDTREQIASLRHAFSVNTMTFSPDGVFIITAGSGGDISEGNIIVWHNDGQLPKNLGFHEDVDKLVFSPDGKYLAAIANSKMARLWSYNGGRFDGAAYLIQGANINDLAFSNGTRIVTAGDDNTTRVWDPGVSLSQDLQEAEPCSRVTRNLTREEWDHYLAPYLGAYRRTCPDIR